MERKFKVGDRVQASKRCAKSARFKGTRIIKQVDVFNEPRYALVRVKSKRLGWKMWYFTYELTRA